MNKAKGTKIFIEMHVINDPNHNFEVINHYY